MLSFNAVEVAVMVDGAELTRYGVQCDNLNNTVTCWIPSEAGKSFSILWSSGAGRSKDTCARVWVDGGLAGGMIQRSSACRDAAQTHLIDRVTVSPTTAHSMMFSVVDHTDYQKDNDPNVPCNNLGQIVVTVSESKERAPSQPQPPKYAQGPAKGPRLSERNKKMVPHKIQLGEVMIPFSGRTYPMQDTKLLAKFIFKYLPIELLVAEGIAPVNLYKRKAENDDPEAVDKAQLEIINDSIALLDEKIVNQSHVSVSAAQGAFNEETEDDSDVEEAKLFSLQNTVRVLRQRLAQKGRAPTKKTKVAHKFEKHD